MRRLRPSFLCLCLSINTSVGARCWLCCAYLHAQPHACGNVSLMCWWCVGEHVTALELAHPRFGTCAAGARCWLRCWLCCAYLHAQPHACGNVSLMCWWCVGEHVTALELAHPRFGTCAVVATSQGRLLICGPREGSKAAAAASNDNEAWVVSGALPGVLTGLKMHSIQCAAYLTNTVSLPDVVSLQFVLFHIRRHVYSYRVYRAGPACGAPWAWSAGP
jgi:hypothetical protein